MQVSWIDPDEVARLAAQLDGPLQPEEAAPWDLDSVQDFSKLFAPEEAGGTEPAQLAEAIAAPVPAALDQRGAAPAPELEHIREKLRAIRSHAQDAGLLPPTRTSGAGPEMAASESPAETAPPPAPLPPPAEIAPSRTPVRIPPAPQAVTNSARPSADPPASFLPPDGSLTERLQRFMPWARSIASCEDILLVDDHGDLLWGGATRADLALSVVLATGAGLRSGSDALTRSSVFIRSRLGQQQELSVLPCPTRYGMVTLALLNATCLTNEAAARLREALTTCVDGSAVAPAAGGDTPSR